MVHKTVSSPFAFRLDLKQEMWWVREGRRVGDDNGKYDVDSTRHSLGATQAGKDPPGKERWETLETALEGQDDRPASSRW